MPNPNPVTNMRKSFLRTLDAELDYLITLPPAEIRYVLGLEISNFIPPNIAQIVRDILRKFPEATFTVGNEGSRVLYVKLYDGSDLKTYVTFMERMAAKYHADEHNMKSSISLKYRFWWD
jgi:hypothetical protein